MFDLHVSWAQDSVTPLRSNDFLFCTQNSWYKLGYLEGNAIQNPYAFNILKGQFISHVQILSFCLSDKHSTVPCIKPSVSFAIHQNSPVQCSSSTERHLLKGMEDKEQVAW